MELRYAFDPSKWRLGTLCPHGHEWPGTGQSLRRIHPRATSCAGCTGRKESDWLVSFINYESLGWPDAHRLGKLCIGGHRWNESNLTLRINRRCPQCDKAAAPAKQKRARDKVKSDPVRLAAQKQKAAEWFHRRCAEDPAFKDHQRMRRREWNAKNRATYGRSSRSKYTTEERELKALCSAISKAGRRFPTVARLVMREQQRYWKANPEEKRRFDTEWARVSWWLQYQINPDLRLYHREKSKRRKAQDRGQTPLQVPVTALRQRFNEFSNCCAYCGQEGDMQIEHVEPISEGGAHDIGNIVPACWPCNSSKRTSEMETWYRQQPFFSELRLQAIRRVTRQPEGAQLALALA